MRWIADENGLFCSMHKKSIDSDKVSKEYIKAMLKLCSYCHLCGEKKQRNGGV